MPARVAASVPIEPNVPAELSLVQLPSAVYADALGRLADRLHYLNSTGDKAADATRYWFDTRANLRREMEDRKRPIRRASSPTENSIILAALLRVPARVAKLSPALKFVLLVGVMSFFADFTYEGSRSIIGQYLGLLGAGALAIGVVTGFGELLGYGLRLFSGRGADRVTVHALTHTGFSPPSAKHPHQ